jgi:phage-related tail fiber protein
MWYAANTAPTGFLKANGAAVSRTTYADLFAAIGTTFGAGDGSTTFNVPDLRGEFIRGWDDGRGIDSGRVFGSTQADANKAHTHSVALTVWSTAGGGGATSLASGVGGSNFGALSTGSSGGTEARPRNITLLACIKF